MLKWNIEKFLFIKFGEDRKSENQTEDLLVARNEIVSSIFFLTDFVHAISRDDNDSNDLHEIFRTNVES